MNLTDYELLYDLPEGRADLKGIDGIRTVTVRAGRSLEVMVHPRGIMTPEARREVKARKTRPAAAKVNDRNRERHMMRLIEENFDEKALVVTLTYAYPAVAYELCNIEDLEREYDECRLPWGKDDVDRDTRNFWARLRRRVAKEGGELKWVQRTEEGKEPPARGLPPKYHVHAVIEGPGITRDVIKALWPHGSVRADEFDMEHDGAARLARYFNKQKCGGRWWSHSRNLRMPKVAVSDRKISRRRVAMIAADVRRDGKEILEALYPGYRVMEAPTVCYSDFAAGCYIYARLRRWRD